MAIAERARPADKLIDLVIAIEALTDESPMEPQKERLVELIAGRSTRASQRALTAPLSPRISYTPRGCKTKA